MQERRRQRKSQSERLNFSEVRSIESVYLVVKTSQVRTAVKIQKPSPMRSGRIGAVDSCRNFIMTALARFAGS